MPQEASQQQRFSSRIGLLLSILGIAVGTGNIWRFPRIVAQNSGDAGAGGFLVTWVIFLFIWSIPLIIAEYALGRKGRGGVIATFIRVAGERFAWMGAFVGFVATAIMFYYSVVAGWCIYYLSRMITDPLPFSTASATAVWEGFQASGGPVFFHALAMLLGGLIIWKGVASIERVSKVLMPVLFSIVIIAVIRAVTLEGSGAGLAFLFTPQWDTLANPRVWLEALTQNAWDTGAGWGLILTYAAYMRHEHGVVKNAFITGIGNNTVSILAAVTIFSTVFAILGQQMSQPEVLEVMRTSGPASTGLTFIWLPQLFAMMPLGRLLAVLFFLGLSFAAFTSLISMIELTTRIFVDGGIPRPKAVLCVAVSGFLLGLPSAFNLNFLGNQDFVWGVGLMISGALIAVVIMKYGVTRFRKEAVDTLPGDWSAGRVWEVLIRYVVPAEAAILLVWWMYLAATEYAPDTWYNPIDPYSVATCIVQWGIVLLAVILLNRWMVRHTIGTTEPEPLT
jgi:neurotransmitter:Na+ symporter, NSS family